MTEPLRIPVGIFHPREAKNVAKAVYDAGTEFDLEVIGVPVQRKNTPPKYPRIAVYAVVGDADELTGLFTHLATKNTHTGKRKS